MLFGSFLQGGYGMKRGDVISFAKIKTARAFKKALAGKPVEEQLAASKIAKNVLNGCSWEFCWEDTIIKDYVTEFEKSNTCSLYKIIYDCDQGVTGYLVYMQFNRLLELLGSDNRGPLTVNDIELANNNRMESGIELIKRIRSGYAGKIGIFYTNDSQTIAIYGKIYPAYAVTLKELCVICEKEGYSIIIDGEHRTFKQILQEEDAFIEKLPVAPSGNALIIEIAPKRR